MGNINCFLKEEINDKDITNRFVSEQLVRFLLSNLINRVFIIDKESVDGGSNGRGITSLSLDAKDPSLSPAARTAAQDLYLKLKTYVSDRKPVIDGNTWRVQLNVMTQRGGIKYWSVTGQLTPFQIAAFQCDIKEADGTFPKILTTD